MALTATQQLKIMKGEIKPPSSPLTDLVHQTANILAMEFYLTSKDTEIASLAESYKNKFYQVSDRIFRQDSNTISALNRIIVTILGTKSFTLAQIETANDGAWESFVKDNMDEAFEFLGAIRKEEKAAYIAIV